MSWLTIISRRLANSWLAYYSQMRAVIICGDLLREVETGAFVCDARIFSFLLLVAYHLFDNMVEGHDVGVE